MGNAWKRGLGAREEGRREYKREDTRRGGDAIHVSSQTMCFQLNLAISSMIDTLTIYIYVCFISHAQINLKKKTHINIDFTLIF